MMKVAQPPLLSYNENVNNILFYTKQLHQMMSSINIISGCTYIISEVVMNH